MGGYVASPKFRVERELEKDLGESEVDGIPNWNPSQVRKGTAKQTSKKLIWHQNCIAGAMNNADFDNLAEAQETFRDATKKCKKENPYS